MGQFLSHIALLKFASIGTAFLKDHSGLPLIIFLGTKRSRRYRTFALNYLPNVSMEMLTSLFKNISFQSVFDLKKHCKRYEFSQFQSVESVIFFNRYRVEKSTVMFTVL